MLYPHAPMKYPACIHCIHVHITDIIGWSVTELKLIVVFQFFYFLSRKAVTIENINPKISKGAFYIKINEIFSSDFMSVAE